MFLTLDGYLSLLRLYKVNSFRKKTVKERNGKTTTQFDWTTHSTKSISTKEDHCYDRKTLSLLGDVDVLIRESVDEVNH